MIRTLVVALLAFLPFGCAGTSPHSDDEQKEHHAEGHQSEHKHKHGGDHEQSKHAHGAQPLGHRFENADEWAKRFDDPKRDAWQMPAQVIELMEIEAGMHAADIGAGTGYFLPYLAAKTGTEGAVLALDIEADMVRYMKERVTREKLVGVSARVVATDDPHVADGSLDRILIVDTWHHLPGRVAYAKKLAAGLKPGGTLTIVDFTMETTRGPPKSHRLTAESILAELEKAGLKAELISETLPDQFVVRASKSQ